MATIPANPTYSLRDRIAEGALCRVLSLDGGGYLGLATAAFIDGIEQHLGVPLHERFDLFCGTSTGALIALALANGSTGRDVVALYERLGPAVFGRRRIGGPYLRAKYDAGPLRAALQEQFGTRTLGDIHSAGKAALVTAFNVTAGQPRVFKTDHTPELTRDGSLSLVDIAMASAAAPTFFAVSRITNPREGITESFCDGGVAANHPGLLGYAEAVSTLGARPDQLRLLSITTPRTSLAEGPASSRSLDRGYAGWVSALPAIFIDANATLAHQVLRRIVDSYPPPGPVYIRIHMSNDERLPMDCASTNATATLKHIGFSQAADGHVRADVRQVTD